MNVTDAIVLEARTAESLRAEARQLFSYLGRRPETTPAQVAHALSATRPRAPHRAVMSASGGAELRSALAHIAEGRPHPRVAAATVPSRRPKTVAVFPGQGQQRPGLLAPLHGEFAVVREVADEYIGRFAVDHGIDVRDYLLDPRASADVDETTVQPALFTQMMAVAALWESAGLPVDAAIGHSQGEIAAAVFAGMTSPADACAVVAARSVLVAALPRQAMAVVGWDERRCRAAIAGWAGDAELAVHNAPSLCCVGGTRDAVTGVIDEVARSGGFARLLPVGYAAHTPAVAPIRGPFISRLHAELGEAGFREGRMECVSPALCGAPIPPGGDQAEFWYANVRNPVRFADAVEAASGNGDVAFVEMSALATIGRSIDETVRHARPGSAPLIIPTADGAGPAGPETWAQGWRTALANGLVPVSAAGPGADVGFPPDFPASPFAETRIWFSPGDSGAPGAGVGPASPTAPDAAEPAPPVILEERWVRLPHLGQERPSPFQAGSAPEWATGLADAARRQGLPEAGATADDAPSTIMCGTPSPDIGGRDVATAIRATGKALDEVPAAPCGSRLVFLTYGAHAVDGTEASPAQSACVPLARAFAARRGYRFRHIDLPGPDMTPECISAAVAALNARGEAALAVRDSGTFVPRLRPPDAGESPADAGALDHVVVTGGRGQVARHVVRALIALGAGRITLLTREPSRIPRDLAAAARAAGIPMDVVRVDLHEGEDRDVGGEESRGGAISADPSPIAVGRPATAVIHTASAYPSPDSPDSLSDAAWLRSAAVDRLLARLPLSEGCRVVVSSSIAATLAHPDTTAYAAAVAAAEAHCANRPEWRVVRWGLWPGSNDAPGFDAVRAADGGTGLLPFDPVTAVSAAIRMRPGVGVVAAADWGMLRRVYDALGAPAYLDGDVASAVVSPTACATTATTGSATPPATAPAGPGDDAAADVRGLCASVLGYPDADQVDPGKALVLLGLTSLQAIELQRKLADVGVDVPVSELLSTATIADLRVRR